MIKNQIPNSLTLLNMLCGCLGILFLFTDSLSYIPYLLSVSLFADFLDGLVARALGVSSPIGKELDSLADVVSFGVLPAMLLVYLMAFEFYGHIEGFNFANALNHISTWQEGLMIGFPLIIALFAAYRLAKFNVSEEQSKEFFGLASPAATIFIVGLFIIHTQGIEVQSVVGQKWLLILVSIIISALMVSNIPMFSFKLSGFSWQENKVQIIFVILSILLFLLFKIGALPLVIILYILINIARSFFSKP